MSKHNKIWARAARLRLIAELGGKCQRCGSTHCLQFHALERDTRHHRLASDGRISWYRVQATVGNIRLLCADCHALTHQSTLS